MGASPSPSNTQSPTLTPQTPSIIDQVRSSSIDNRAVIDNSLTFQNLSSMFAAAAAAASGQPGNRVPGFFGQLPKRPSGLDSPPASLDNRSTPGSLDLSRSKDADNVNDNDADFVEDLDSNSNDMPPTMVSIKPKIKHLGTSELNEEEEEETRRDAKRGFSDDAEDLTMESKRPRRDSENASPVSENNQQDLEEPSAKNIEEEDKPLAENESKENGNDIDSNHKKLTVRAEFREETIVDRTDENQN